MNDLLHSKEKEFDEQTRPDFAKVFGKQEANLTEAELKRRACKFLSKRVIGTLATCADNVPRSTTVRYQNQGFTIYVMTEGGGKVHNISLNPMVSFSVFGNYSGFHTVRGLQLWGTAEIITPDAAQEYQQAFETMKLNQREDLKQIGANNIQPGMTIIRVSSTRGRYLSLPEGILNRELSHLEQGPV